MNAIECHPNKKAYNWIFYRNLNRELMAEKSKILGTVYDLGCGEAPYRDFILDSASSYVGVDWEGSPHKINADIIADLNKPLPISSEGADVVIAISVLEHLSEPKVMLNEAARILKEGGLLLLQIPWQWRIHEAPFDYYRYSPYGIRVLCEDAGFFDITIKPIGGFFEMMALKINYFSLRCLGSFSSFKWLSQRLLWPFWQLTQVCSLCLRWADRNPMSECCGYIVTARRRK